VALLDQASSYKWAGPDVDVGAAGMKKPAVMRAWGVSWVSLILLETLIWYR
jgi:hypothetical protein